MPPGAELPTIAALAYLTIFAATALDIFLPVVPSDGLVIAGAAIAVHGDLSLPLVMLAAAGGSWTGDLACYGIGRWFGGHHPLGERHLPRWWQRRQASSPRLAHAAALRQRLSTAIPVLFRGHVLVVLAACRLMPGGRTVGAATAGRIGLPLRRFLGAELIIGAVWAVQQSTIGYVSGSLLPSGVSIAGLLPVAELVLTVIAFTVGVRLLHNMVKKVPVAGEEPRAITAAPSRPYRVRRTLSRSLSLSRSLRRSRGQCPRSPGKREAISTRSKP